jgi:hypothetical protein
MLPKRREQGKNRIEKAGEDLGEDGRVKNILKDVYTL